MELCDNCLCLDVCDGINRISAGLLHECKHFKDQSKFIELPCKVGDTVYHIGTFIDGIEIETIDHFGVFKDSVVLFSDPWDGEICEAHQVGKAFKDEYDWNGYFLTKEEAEQALGERENNESVDCEQE